LLINEIEHIVGLSKKSIRLYEEEGLLKPKRHPENDYRIYDEEDIKKLKIIKFMRELGVPIKELKELFEGTLSLEDCMNERIDKITREEEKFARVRSMCIEIRDSKNTFEEFNFDKYFEVINILGKEGFTLRDVKSNKTKKIVGAIIPSVIFGCMFIFIPGIITYFQFTEVEKIPWIIYWAIVLLFSLPFIGLIINVFKRIKEINGGEEDEASKY